MADNQKQYITPETKAKLEEELNALIAHRPVVAAEINERREEGDLKENAGYDAAREMQDQEEARIKAATAAVSEAQARINLAFAQYLLNHGECKDIAALLMTPLGDEKGDGSLYIGDDDAHFEDKTAGKVGGWIFWVDESKKLETVNEDTRVGLLEDPDGNKIDISETGLYLRIPQCNSSNKDEK